MIKQSLLKPVVYVLAMAILVIYLVILFANAVNVPFQDDYDLYLCYLISFQNNSYFDHRLFITFGQHNEHRPVIERLIVIIQSSCFGRVNFTHLIYMGNAMLFFSGILFFKQYRSQVPAVVLLFLISVLFLNFNSWENMLWATGALQNYTGLFLCLLSFIFAMKQHGKNWIFSFLFSLLAMLTGGLGLFSCIIILLYFIVKERKYLRSFLFLLLSVVPYYLYFKNYLSNPGHADAKFWIVYFPYDVFQYFIVFLGNFMVGLGIKNIIWTQLMGYILLAFSIYTLFRFRRTNSFSLMVICLVLLAGVAAALSRVNFTYAQALAPRYQILSLSLFFVFVVEAVYPILKRYQVQWIIIPSMLAFYIASLTHNISAIKKMNVELKTSAYCHWTKPDANNYQHPAIYQHPQNVLKESALHKIYFIPKFKGPYNCK